MPPSISRFIDTAKEGRVRRRRLLLTILVISIVVHLLGGVGAGIWVIAKYFNQPKAQFVVNKTVKMPVEDREHQLQMEETASLRPKPVYNNRIQSLRPSKLALPDIPKVEIETIPPIDTETLITDQVDGQGRYGTGNGSGGGFFGGSGSTGSGLLEGTFYDCKQAPDGQPTKWAEPQSPPFADFKRFIRSFSSGWRSDMLAGFYQSPHKLYTSQISIPIIGAGGGPKEFQVQNKVQPRFWLVHYTGRVKAPKSGKFRFVGWGDDILLVRFNGRNVLDGSQEVISDRSRRSFDLGMGKWESTYGPGRTVPGHFVGNTFTVEEGKPYDIEILIGEFGGGHFNATLLIQDMSEEYTKDERSSPILPFFKQRASDIESKLDKIPPFDRDAPIWSPTSRGRSLLGL